MRKLINLIQEAQEGNDFRSDPRWVNNVPVLGIREGEFIQLSSWFGDVWAYVTKSFCTSNKGSSTICYARRDKYGNLYTGGSYSPRNPKRDEMIQVGELPNLDKGSLMRGYNSCPIRKVVTSEDLRQKITAGEGLIITMPQFKVSHWVVWKDGEKIGTLGKDSMIALSDGKTFDLFSVESL